MKRLWVALVLLLTVGGICTFSVIHQRKQISALLEDLDRLETVYEEGDLSTCREAAAALQMEYARRTALFPCFISHDDLTDSQSTAATLSAALQEDNPEEFLLETARLRAQLEWLLEVDSPHWKNIL